MPASSNSLPLLLGPHKHAGNPQVVLVDIEVADGRIAAVHRARSQLLLSPGGSGRGERPPPPLQLQLPQPSAGPAGPAAAPHANGAAAGGSGGGGGGVVEVDLAGGMVWPTFLDLHTHVDKAHTCERSRNEDGSLDGAGVSCDSDEAHWTEDELRRRMHFALRCAYAHGARISSSAHTLPSLFQWLAAPRTPQKTFRV